MNKGFTPIVLLPFLAVSIAILAIVFTNKPSYKPHDREIQAINDKQETISGKSNSNITTNSRTQELESIVSKNNLYRVEISREYQNETYNFYKIESGKLIKSLTRADISELSKDYDKELLNNISIYDLGWNKHGNSYWGYFAHPGNYGPIWEFRVDENKLYVYEEFHQIENSSSPRAVNIDKRVYVFEDKPISFGVGDLDDWHLQHNTYSLYLFDLVTNEVTLIDTLPGKFPDEGGMLRVKAEWISDVELVYETPEGYKRYFIN